MNAPGPEAVPGWMGVVERFWWPQRAAFGAEEAQRIARRLELHYTPKHGSWLNMVEIELSVLERQCLARRIGSREELEQETAAWETARNACHATVNWRFTTEKARQKLHWLYQPKQS